MEKNLPFTESLPCCLSSDVDVNRDGSSRSIMYMYNIDLLRLNGGILSFSVTFYFAFPLQNSYSAYSSAVNS